MRVVMSRALKMAKLLETAVAIILTMRKACLTAAMARTLVIM